jgi:hypothetical protein
LFSEIVLNVTWAQLQALENGPIETAFIQAVTAYNAGHGTNLGIKLRSPILIRQPVLYPRHR